VRQGYSKDSAFNEQTIPNYYNYSYPHYAYTPESTFPYIESTAPVNNERYTGRLKFFDQQGNYG
jgi:hypothetical protein